MRPFLTLESKLRSKEVRGIVMAVDDDLGCSILLRSSLVTYSYAWARILFVQPNSSHEYISMFFGKT